MFQRSLIDTTGINSGSIQLQGLNINLYSSSVIVNSSQIAEQKGIVNIEAKESVLIDGIAQDGIARSEITNQTLGLSDSGAVRIKAQNLTISDGGILSNKSYGEGRGGEITIQVSESLLIYSGFNISSFLPGGISTLNFNQGNSGDIRVNATKIQLDNGSVIGSGSFSSGNAGNVFVHASEIIQVNGFNPNGLIASSLGSLAFANGNAGKLDIKTKNLIVEGAGRVNTTTFNSGNAGNINIDYLNIDRFLEFNPLPNNFMDGTKEIIASCRAGDNKFAIAGNGGFPENPGQYIRGQTVWQDLRLLSNKPNQLTDNLSASKYSRKPTITEAKTWKINQRGNIELLANVPVGERSNFARNNHKC